MASGKRTAGRELNHDNWNEEEEGEDAGQFKKATEEELQKRVRKVAKRRNAGDSENNAPVNPFSGFGGFKASTTGFATSTPAPNASPFSFLAKIPSATASKPLMNGTSETSTNKEKTGAQTEYASKVKALNIAVADWIKTHVDDNPLCILTPIFKDYEKYLKEFEELKKKKQTEEKQTPAATTTPDPKPKDPSPVPTPTFSFGKPSAPTSSSSNSTTSSNSAFSSFSFGGGAQKTAVASPPKPAATESKGITSGFSFGSGTSTLGATPSTASSTFSFGLQATSTPAFGGFSSTPAFGGFGGVVQAPKTDPAPTAEEDEEPPKNEFKAVVEEDSLYSKRCKVYVKGASDYSDRGVGTLYIKKVEDSKVQMIVRADTNLGNILFNIILVDGLPCSRMGKNNVMIVCVPTPDAKPPPTSVLLRVKTGEEADELLAKINECKK